MQLLLLEDDIDLGQAVSEHLEAAGHGVHWCKFVAQARQAPAFDMALLDLQLADGDGLTLLRDWRSEGVRQPVIALTARDQVSDRIRGLDAGADDYLVKPYEPEELLARLRAVERRRGAQSSSTVTRGEVQIDLAREVVRNGMVPVVLTPKEWALLRVLASRPGQTFTRERLLEALYQWDGASDSNTLEVFISRLRRKLGSDLIETVRGTGYRLMAQ